MLGERPTWAQAYTAWSARELGALPSALAFNGEVALRLGSGWLRPIGHRGVEDLHEGQGEVHYDGVHPVATSKVDGLTRSVSAVCPHLRGVLAWNDAELSWDCPLHGSRFGPDGTLLEGPATCDLASRST